MIFKLVELGVNFRQAAGVGGNEVIDFGLAQSAAVAIHGGGFRSKVFGRGPVNALGLERATTDTFRLAGFSESAIATHFPHFADSFDFDGAEFPVVKVADFRFGKIAFGIHGAGGHENMPVDVSMVAFGVGMVQANAKGYTVVVAQLQAESPDKLPLLLSVQLMGHGHIHRAAHAGIPPLFRLLGASDQLAGRHARADDLPLDDIGFVL